jgi:hypothetical protein
VPRRLIPVLVVAAITVAGLAGLSYGILLATALAPPIQTTGQVSGAEGAPVVDTATGVLDLDGPRVQVRATALSGGPVFIGIARADDVRAYLADVSRTEITRVGDDGRLTTVRAGTQRSLPNPSEADIWVASSVGAGTSSLVWPDTPGPWRLVVAGDGTTAAPQQISLVWSREQRSNPASAVIAVGALLLVGGLVGLLLVRGRRQDAEDAEDAEDGLAGKTGSGGGTSMDGAPGAAGVIKQPGASGATGVDDAGDAEVTP